LDALDEVLDRGRGGKGDGMSRRLSIVGTRFRDAKPERGAEEEGEEESCTE